MFEYAVSCGDGTLLDYGVKTSEWMNHYVQTKERIDFSEDGDVWALTEFGYQIKFRPASPDCLTGQ